MKSFLLSEIFVCLCLIPASVGTAAEIPIPFVDPALGTIITITPQTEIRLGQGINPDSENIYEDCIDLTNSTYKAEEFDETVLTDQSSAPYLKLDVRSLSSYQDIDNFTNTSISANIKAATYKGSFDYSGTEKYQLTSDIATVGINSHADFGRWYLQNPKLKLQYLEVYERDPEEFFKRCGSQYVAGYKRSQGIMVLLSTADRSEYNYKKISTTASASASMGGASGKISASFLNVAESLLQLGSLQVQVTAYGAGNIPILESLIKSDSDVGKLAEQIATIVGQMTPQKSVKTAYLTANYPNVNYNGIQASNPILQNHRRDVMQSLFYDYRRLSQDLFRLNESIRSQDGFLASIGNMCPYASASTGSCEDYIQSLTGLKVQIESAISKVEGLTKACSNAKEVKDCVTASAADVRVGDLIVSRWNQQYKYELINDFLNAPF